MLSARQQFRHLIERELGGEGLTRQARWDDVLRARRCRNVFFGTMGPVVTSQAGRTPNDVIVQAQTLPFGNPIILTDMLNFDEIYVAGFFQGVVFGLMRIFTSGVGFQEDFFGAGNFLDSLMMLGHYQSNEVTNTDAPSLKAHFMPYMMPTGQIIQVNWELLDMAGPNGNVKTVAAAAGGAGYAVGDVLTLTTGGTGATVRVTAVAAGVVTGVLLLTSGSGYAAGVSATAGGGGAGATITITVTATLTVRSQYNPEAHFRGLRVLDASDAYASICGRLYDAICAQIKKSEPESFILDLDIPTASFPAAGATAVFTTEQQSRPLLIYGISTNINGAQVTMRDPATQWEFVQIPAKPNLAINAGAPVAGNYGNIAGLPIQAVFGNADVTYHEAYNMLPVPHLLEPNTQLIIRLTNGIRSDGLTGVFTQTIDTNSNFGNSTGNAHLTFLCRTV